MQLFGEESIFNGGTALQYKTMCIKMHKGNVCNYSEEISTSLLSS